MSDCRSACAVSMMRTENSVESAVGCLKDGDNNRLSFLEGTSNYTVSVV